MKKLTRKEFISLFPGTDFIAATCRRTVKEQVTEEVKIAASYTAMSVRIGSKDIVITTSKGSTSYRNFYGCDTFLKEDRLLIHINEQDGYITVMVNMQKEKKEDDQENK